MKKNSIMFSLVAVIFLLTGCGVDFKPVSAQSDNGNTGNNVVGQMGSEKIVTFDVTGKGLEPETATTKGEAVIMAERAAIIDGYRQFVEKLHGVYVDAYMKAGYGTVNHDLIKTNTQSWLRGVEIVETRQGNYGITEVHMQLRINFTKQGMVWWPSGIGSNISPS